MKPLQTSVWFFYLPLHIPVNLDKYSKLYITGCQLVYTIHVNSFHKLVQKLAGNWKPMEFCCIKHFQASRRLVYICKHFYSTVRYWNCKSCRGGAQKINNIIDILNAWICLTFLVILGENFFNLKLGRCSCWRAQMQDWQWLITWHNIILTYIMYAQQQIEKMFAEVSYSPAGIYMYTAKDDQGTYTCRLTLASTS